ncbi:hypothetical protein [Streptomyces sp. NPDC058268]|uniref:hypothetical protein n=1 Tax=Streptomyces sp. NPDC058268 TaxID=3346413 RepID=UPI0036E7127E
MAEESEDLVEIAHALLDEQTGNFTTEAAKVLEYAGMDLLVMDRVQLQKEWGGARAGSDAGVRGDPPSDARLPLVD